MSQPNENYPAFHYTTSVDGPPFFDPHGPQPSDEYPQWTQPGPGPARNTPSPSGSAPAAMTAPMYYHSSQSMPLNVHQSGRRMQNNLQALHLAVPNTPGHPHSNISSPINMDPIQSPDYRYSSSFPTNPTPHMVSDPRTSIRHGITSMGERPDSASNEDPVLMRVYGGHHDEPWSAMRVTTHDDTNSGNSSFPGTNTRYTQYRRHPRSEIGSAAGHASDSGYFTHPPTHSVTSNEPGRVDQELPSDMFRMPNLTVSSAPSESTEYVADRASQYSGRSAGQNKTTYQCSQCKEISKCPSDYKKHMLKHDKPHTCDVSGCRRAALGKGFTTINDLLRHKKSVHRIGVERDSYQCASEHCRNRGKIWPRLDNFKQHIHRMHKDEDETELIQKSSYRGQISPYVTPQADIALLGIGVEGQVPGNELENLPSGISLTPDQDENPWGSFDPGSHKYALDIDRMNRHENSQFLSAPDTNIGSGLGKRSATPLSSTGSDSRRNQGSFKLSTSARHSPDVPLQRPVSNAPQTKAEQQRLLTHTEQQRLALQKFGKALMAEVGADPSADGTDLENVVLRVLSGTSQQRRNQDGEVGSSSSNEEPRSGRRRFDTVMTKAEALKASQAISNLIKQSRSPASMSRSRRSSRVSTSEKLQCPHCEVTLARACDMKKHMKRHTKPYGCTYPNCHKRFGAKSDWKRHENSQHFQMEAFRCQRAEALQTHCGELFHRVELFKQHMTHEHKVVDDVIIREEVKTSRIGKNYQGQFWCGFCQTIVKLKKKRNAAWDERFDHIDAHFNKEKRGIDQWLCVEARKTKGDLLKDIDRTKFDDEDDDGEGEEDDSPAGYDASFQMSDVSPIPPSMPLQDFSRKRVYPADEFVTPSKRRKMDVDRYCCSCRNGPWCGAMYAACMNCDHQICINCPVDGAVGLDQMMV